MPTVRQFLVSQSGATAIEYCLIAGSIALVIVTSVFSVGVKISKYYNQIAAVN